MNQEGGHVVSGCLICCWSQGWWLLVCKVPDSETDGLPNKLFLVYALEIASVLVARGLRVS